MLVAKEIQGLGDPCVGKLFARDADTDAQLRHIELKLRRWKEHNMDSGLGSVWVCDAHHRHLDFSGEAHQVTVRFYGRYAGKNVGRGVGL